MGLVPVEVRFLSFAQVFGTVAHLGERCFCKADVGRSNRLGSTNARTARWSCTGFVLQWCWFDSDFGLHGVATIVRASEMVYTPGP